MDPRDSAVSSAAGRGRDSAASSRAPLEVIFVCVSRGTTVLAEFANPSHAGNYETVTRLLLRRIDGGAARLAQLRYDAHVFHYAVAAGVTYLAMTDAAAGSRLPFAFLRDVEDAFRAAFGDEAPRTAIAFEMDAEFSPVLRQKCEFYATNRDADVITSVRGKIDDARDVMLENIDQLLERGEKIELLVDKADAMQQQAFRFRRSARTLRQTMCCKRCKIYIFLGVLVLIVAFFVAAMACGGLSFSSCL